MSSYILAAAARRDLDQIDDYISANNPAAADRLLASFYETFKLLAANPGAGRRRDEFSPGLRSFPIGNYLVFYRQSDSSIEIARVLHGGRDMRRLFEQ